MPRKQERFRVARAFETEAEAAACLVFAGLRSDQVEFRSDAPLMAIAAAP
ncbi:MAG: hypothetical protein OXN81_16905 [Alphaproteobacteria bacterium]|nr:hypothetical protein [Alphaproteobacteria bacterium]